MADADEILRALTGDLTPIRKLTERLMGPDACLNSVSGALCVSHRPLIGTEAYALSLFPGLPDGLIADYESLHGVAIPAPIRSVVQCLDGAFLFRMSLFGIPPSMARQPPLLDRSTSWPLDIGTAQRTWRIAYSAAPDEFYFGGGPFSHEEDVAYFLGPDGRIRALRKGGVPVDSWRRFGKFLKDELARAEASYPAFENFMAR